MEDYWTDIGNIYSFFEANLPLQMEIPLFNLFDNRNVVYSRARMLPPPRSVAPHLSKNSGLQKVPINASRIENSVIGIRSRIGQGTTMVLLYDDDYFETLDDITP